MEKDEKANILEANRHYAQAKKEDRLNFTFSLSSSLHAKATWIAKEKELTLKDILNKALSDFITLYEYAEGSIPATEWTKHIKYKRSWGYNTKFNKEKFFKEGIPKKPVI